MLIPERGRIRHGSRDLDAVALSFDDGPSEHTLAILDALAREQAKASFFVVGNRIAGRQAVLEAVASAGHELASHSHTHARLGAHPLRAAIELRRSCNAIKRTAGARPRAFRPPYADFSRRLALAARLHGLRTVTWDVDPRDWEGVDAAAIEDEVLAAARPGSIVLMHEGPNSPATVKALPAIIRGLRARSLELLTVTELLDRSDPPSARRSG